MNDDLPYIYLPFVKDVVDMTQPQVMIDADIQFALNGQGGTTWNSTDWGSATEFWKFLISRYGHYRIMQQYTEEVNDQLICDPLDFNVFTHPILVANREKYNRLAGALKTSYDVLKPYNIQEEHSSAGDTGKLSTTYASHTDTDSESSMDSAALINKNSTSYGAHTDTVDYTHDRSVDFNGTSFESNRDHIEHSKDSRIGNIGNHSYAELIEKEIKLARYNFWDIIAKDILDNGCLKIFYTSC
jgi:hypothetical protein